MQLIIERATNTITIDGRSHVVDLVQLQPEVVRVAWHDDHGTVSYADGTIIGLGHWERFKALVDLWQSADDKLRVR